MTDCVVTRDERPHVQRGAHGGHCPGQACDGCLPVPALPGLLVCGDDVDKVRAALRELPDLWLALAEPTDHTGEGNRVDDTPRALPPLVGARSVIRSTLVTWCKVLEDEHGAPLPDERVIARRTVQDAYDANTNADVAIDAARAHMRNGDTERAGALLAEQRRYRQSAIDLRNRRIDGVDLIDGLREHVDRHLLTLLAHDSGRGSVSEAQVFAEDVLDVRNRARALAYPRRPAVRVTCSCGGTVPLDADQPKPDAPARTFRCSGCGTTGTLDDWRRMEAPDTDEPLPLSRIAGWLASAHGYEVTLKQLRHWRDRDIIRPVDCCIPYGALGPHKPGCTQRFDPAAVLLVARHRLEGKRSA